MDIIIHTYGRAQWEHQHTLRQLWRAGIRPRLLIQKREEFSYPWADPYADIVVLPERITQLAPTRDWIIHDMNLEKKVVFLDDDLHFAVRRSDDPSKFRQPEGPDIVDMFDNIAHSLNFYAHAGIGPREGGNRVTERRVFNTRIMRLLAYRRDVLRRENIFFTPQVVMEDFHVNLQLLRAGYTTVVENRWVSNQAEGSDAPGGCSSYRTADVQTASANMLAARHPGYVKVVRKMMKTAWGGKERTDVIIQWKKAWQDGQRTPKGV